MLWYRDSIYLDKEKIKENSFGYIRNVRIFENQNDEAFSSEQKA
jgi:hypothetical protein